MRTAILMVFTLLYSMPLMPQGSDGKLRSELESLHAQWFKAFDSGDGATMDQMEVDNLTLVNAGGIYMAEDGGQGGSSKEA